MKLMLSIAVSILLIAPTKAQYTHFNDPSQPFAYRAVAGSQFNLVIGTGTTLTVPTGAVCAQITLEGGSVRRTSDSTAASTTVGTLIQAGASWSDCGPLALYQFTSVTGSPKIDVEYFR
jgi:hypothetical protein